MKLKVSAAITSVELTKGSVPYVEQALFLRA